VRKDAQRFSTMLLNEDAKRHLMDFIGCLLIFAGWVNVFHLHTSIGSRTVPPDCSMRAAALAV